MTLAKHKTQVPARLVVLEGEVKYMQDNEINSLQKYDSQDIPPEVMHEVFAEKDSLCMLIKC
jgi:quercetin dioxygenase-like cupin family protein